MSKPQVARSFSDDHAIYVIFCGRRQSTSCFPIISNMAHGLGNIDVGGILQQVVINFQRIPQTAPRYLTWLSYTMAENWARGKVCSLWLRALLVTVSCQYQCKWTSGKLGLSPQELLRVKWEVEHRWLIHSLTCRKMFILINCQCGISYDRCSTSTTIWQIRMEPDLFDRSIHISKSGKWKV